MGASVSTIAYGGGDVVSINALTFSAADIDFVSTSTAYAADVMVVRGGTADLSRCYFGGGTYVGQYGRGLYVDGYADVSVTDCAFTLNDMSGISVFDQASVSVYNCSMSDNGENGVTLAEDAVGVINQSECLRNALHGVSVNDYATLAIQNSKCSQNGSAGDYASGIYFEEYATGTVNNCECNYNRIDGIALHEYAVATIQHATCNYNGTDGIALTENADGTISSCECSTTRRPASGSADSPPASPTATCARKPLGSLRRRDVLPHRHRQQLLLRQHGGLVVRIGDHQLPDEVGALASGGRGEPIPRSGIAVEETMSRSRPRVRIVGLPKIGERRCVRMRRGVPQSEVFRGRGRPSWSPAPS